jgi:hypothetical protein
MNKNMGTIDRILRVTIAVLIGALYLAGEIGGTMGLIFLIIGAVLLLTSVISFCPIYSLLKLTTLRKD